MAHKHKEQLDFVSGQKARQFRKALSGSASDPSPDKRETVRTLAFPIDISPLGQRAFNEAAQLGNIVDGVTASGTLYGLLTTLLCTGFGVYSSAAERKKAEISSRRPDDPITPVLFQEQLKASTGLLIQGMSPLELFTEVSTRRRSNNKSDLRGLIDRWIKADKDDGRSVEFVVEMQSYLVAAMQTGGMTVFNLPERIDTIGRLVDSFLNAKGFSLPSFEEAFTQIPDLTSESENFANSTVAFDPSAPRQAGLDPLLRMHFIVARFWGEARRHGNGEKQLDKYIQSRVTTANGNGFSWLFNPKEGLGYLRDTSEETLIADFKMRGSIDAAEAISIVQNVQSVARSIPGTALFVSTYGPLHNSRSRVQGKLDSWISNYVSRLGELVDSVSKVGKLIFPEDLEGDAYRRFFLRSGVNVDALKVYGSELPMQAEKIRGSLEILQGAIPFDSTAVESVDRFNRFLGELAGSLSAINKRIEDAREAEEADVPRDLPRHDWLKAGKKLNSISGGTPEYRLELCRLAESFRRLLAARADHFERVRRWASEQSIPFDNAFVAQEEYERRQETEGREAAQRRRETFTLRGSVAERARRQVLERLSRVCRNGSPRLRRIAMGTYLEDGVCSRTILNRYFEAIQGGFYVAYRSRSRHDPYVVGSGFLRTFDPLAFIGKLQGRLRSEGAGDYNSDLLSLENLAIALRLGNVPGPVPGDLNRCVELASIAFRLPYWANDPTRSITSLQLQYLFNMGYHSNLSGLATQLTRPGFRIAVSLSPYMKDQARIQYSPKQGSWMPPRHYLHAGGSLEAPLKELGVPTEPGTDITLGLDVEKTARAIVSTLEKNPSSLERRKLATILSQLPHDWVLHADLSGLGESRWTVKVQKGVIKSGASREGCIRLGGPPSYKTALDRALLDGEISPPTIVIEREVRQTLDEGKVIFKDVSVRGFVNIPLAEPASTPPLLPRLRNVLGVDLGETGIGFAVIEGTQLPNYEYSRAKLISSAFLPIRSLRRLINEVNVYRRRTQPRQRYRDAFASPLKALREAAIADTVAAIDGLCAKYEAIPILESSVGAFETGSQRLKVIYESVLKYYRADNVDAHQAVRQHHFMGAWKWVHPFFERPARRTEVRASHTRDQLQLRPLALFPGAVIHPAGTSRICSACKRNSFQALGRYLTSHSEGAVPITGKGCLSLDDGVVQFERPASVDPIERARLNRARLRRSFAPIDAGLYPRGQLFSLLAQSVRRPNPSRTAKDTTQSIFVCPYVDCAASRNADENAAENIARRWLERQGENQRAFDQWDSLGEAERQEVLARLQFLPPGTTGKGPNPKKAKRTAATRRAR